MIITARNGKQCRERWLTALDPSIKKSQWTLKEDQEFLEQWLKLGNKWREIANIIEGRTESQVKNRFKLILRREHIQQTKIDPDTLRSQIIPRIIESIKKKISSGHYSKSQNAGMDCDDDDSDSGDPTSSKPKQKKQKSENIMNQLESIDVKKQSTGSKSKKGAKGRGKKNPEDSENEYAHDFEEDDQEMNN